MSQNSMTTTTTSRYPVSPFDGDDLELWQQNAPNYLAEYWGQYNNDSKNLLLHKRAIENEAMRRKVRLQYIDKPDEVIPCRKGESDRAR